MKAHDVATMVENLEFLDESKVGANEAAERAGFASAEAMEKWLQRNGAYDLWLSFKSRDPVGIHSQEQRRERAQTARADGWSALLDEAVKSTRARTRNKAEKIRAMLTELRSTVSTEKVDDERRGEAAKEVERLERELAKAKARLRGGTSTTLIVSDSVSAAELREWALSQGIACPPRGRIPNAVRDAYESLEKAS